MVVASPVVAQSPVPAHTFHIVGDRFFNSGFNMTEADIQTFLDEHGAACDDPSCLKYWRDPETNEPAARIIHRTARDLGLHPGIILITLQKENSLVTIDNPEPWRYQTAMGYGCPDHADCDRDFFGFRNQVRLGATLLRVGYDRACGDKTTFLHWRIHPRWYRGHVTPIDGRLTRLDSCATAALYNYTPHRVDSAWRPSPLDGQYYYGNYNFVYFYLAWFEER